MLGGKKQILIVGNDGLQLYLAANKKISLYGEFSVDSENLTEELRTAFTEIKAPLLILYDVVEQQYRKETIPPVGTFDKSKVIQRKLLMAFPQQEMRAFLPLKQKAADDGMTLLFAALANTPVIDQIMQAILRSEIFVSGTGLLPLESTSLVTKLVQLTHERARIDADTRWSVLMTYQKTGGLRQIVIKDGELALTRLTPLSIDSNDSRYLIDEMAREFNSTLIYLSRFGYVPSDGLDLIVISSQDVCQQLRQMPLAVTHLYPLTPQEAGQMLGMNPVTQGDTIHGEVIHAAWGGLQRKIAVPLTTSFLGKIKTARQAVRALIVLLFLASCGLLYENTMLQMDTISLQSDIVEQNSKKQVLQHDVDELNKKLNVLKYDPEKINSIIALGDKYTGQNMDVEPTLKAIISLIDRSRSRIKEISITAADSFALSAMNNAPGGAAPAPTPAPAPSGGAPGGAPGGGADANAEVQKPVVIIKMTMAFAVGLPIEQAAVLTNEFVAGVQKNMPKMRITIEKIAGDLAVDRTVKGASEQIAQGKVVGEFIKDEVSTFVITGALQ